MEGVLVNNGKKLANNGGKCLLFPRGIPFQDTSVNCCPRERQHCCNACSAKLTPCHDLHKTWEDEFKFQLGEL